MTSDRVIIGWREWLALPDLGIEGIKAKIDTGARSSALHAIHIESLKNSDRTLLRFQVHPYQRDSHTTLATAAELLDWRQVTTSAGHRQLRPTIRTTVVLGEHRWKIDLTLTNRDVMGFRMLLGREALRERFLVHPSESFLLSDRAKTLLE